MRKHSRALVALVLGSSMILGACSGGGQAASTEAPKAAETTAAPESKAEESKAEETSAEAQGGKMSHDELVEAAKKESWLFTPPRAAYPPRLRILKSFTESRLRPPT